MTVNLTLINNYLKHQTHKLIIYHLLIVILVHSNKFYHKK